MPQKKEFCKRRILGPLYPTDSLADPGYFTSFPVSCSTLSLPAHSTTLKLEAVDSSETLLYNYINARGHIPETRRTQNAYYFIVVVAERSVNAKTAAKRNCNYSGIWRPDDRRLFADVSEESSTSMLHKLNKIKYSSHSQIVINYLPIDRASRDERPESS